MVDRRGRRDADRQIRHPLGVGRRIRRLHQDEDHRIRRLHPGEDHRIHRHRVGVRSPRRHRVDAVDDLLVRAPR